MRLCSSNARGMDGLGTKIPHPLHCGQKKEKEKKRNRIIAPEDRRFFRDSSGSIIIILFDKFANVKVTINLSLAEEGESRLL